MRAGPGTPILALFSLLAVLVPAGAGPVDRSAPPPIKVGEALRAPPCDERRLANGLRLLVVERRAIPSVHLVWSVNAGSADDPPGLPGVAALLAEALVRGSGGGGDSLAERLRGRGVLLDVKVDRDSIRFSIQAPADRLRWAVRRLRRALFPAPAEIETARSLALDELARRSGDPKGLFAAAAWTAVYGPAHPYGRPVHGMEDSLHAIDAADLRRFHEEHFRPGRMTVVVAGDVEVATLRRELERLKPPRAATVPSSRREPPPVPDRVGAPRIVLIDRPGSSRATIGAAVRLSHAIEPLDPAALVANHLLGGPGYSRLLGALRNELGHAYDARSWIEFRGAGGLLLARSAVGVENAAPALRRLLAEVEALQRESPEEEVARARISLGNGLLAGWFETNRTTARAWARLTLLGLDRGGLNDRLRGIASVRAEDTARFAREQLAPERLVLLVVGDAARLAEPLGELGLGPAEVWDVDLSRREVAGTSQNVTP